MVKQPIPYILIQKGGVLKPYKEISKKELIKFNRLNNYLREFEASQSILPLVKTNAVELDNYVTHLQNINHKLPVPRLEHIEIDDEVNRLLLNFLTSARLYLDHTETRLKKRYGAESEQFKKFKLATSSAYDELFAYRFFYKLRNYVQHCGMAINITSDFSSSKNIPGRVDIHKMRIEFDPQELLDNYNDWGPVKKDLEKQKENLKVHGFASEVLNELQLIDSYTYLGEYQELYKAGNWIVDLIEDAFSVGENPQVGTLQKHGKKLNASFTIPALDVLQVVGVVDFRGKESGNKPLEYFPMFGFCFKITWNENENLFTVTSPSIPELSVQDVYRENAIDKAEIQFKSIMKEYLQSKKRPPAPLTWREQYKLINKDSVNLSSRQLRHRYSGTECTSHKNSPVQVSCRTIMLITRQQKHQTVVFF